MEAACRRQTMNRDPLRVWRTGAALHRWLHRAAVTAIPIAGLCSCGNNCENVSTETRFVDGGVAWEPGSRHSAAECLSMHYCLDTTGRNPCTSMGFIGCVVSPAAASPVECKTRHTGCGPPCGRLPAGLRWSSTATQPSAVAAHLAASAQLEGASVFAFEVLERELLAHGAP